MRFKTYNRTGLDNVVVYIASQCSETVTYSTSRFHSYGGETTWIPLQPRALSQRVSANYTLDQPDYNELAAVVNRFTDERYGIYAPDYPVAHKCVHRASGIQFDSVPWSIEPGMPAVLYVGGHYVAFNVGTVNDSRGKTTVTGDLIDIPNGFGVFMLLAKASVVSSSVMQTTSAQATGSVSYEFETPRDFTVGNYTVNDFPNPRGVIRRTISLPDTQFRSERVRGRRGQPFVEGTGWGNKWGFDWGGTSQETATQKDNSYQATFVDSVVNKDDYKIKNVLARSLLSGDLLSLQDDNLNRFAAMLDSDVVTTNYNAYAYTITISYSRRRLKQR